MKGKKGMKPRKYGDGKNEMKRQRYREREKQIVK